MECTKNYSAFNYPCVNITMPVFNRYDQTLATILAVHEHTTTPYFLTVVDNGSQADLRKELLALYRRGLIHDLLLADKNYGISGACNAGWRLRQTPFFMKLDNDIKVLSDTWLNDIFIMWGSKRYSTLMGPVWNDATQQCRQVTPYGTFWSIPVSVSGEAFLVSRKVSEQMGYFCEDYGLYGEEDADYCMRCHHAGIRKYTYEASGMLLQTAHNDAFYQDYGLDKKALHRQNTGTGTDHGLFALKLFLYEQRLVPLKAQLKYSSERCGEYEVRLIENKEYAAYFECLNACLEIYNDKSLETPVQVEKMRAVLPPQELVCGV